MGKRKRGLKNNSSIQEHLDFHHGIVYRTVYNAIGDPVFDIPIENFQQHTRDLIEALEYRWSHGIPCGSLTASNVFVKDNVATLPAVGTPTDSKQYALRLQQHVESVYGTTGLRPDREDFMYRLRTPGLNRRQFGALYFHPFLQNQEERGNYASEFVKNLRDRRVLYRGSWMHWEKAYLSWEMKHYNQQFQLQKTCSQHPHHHWALMVYLHGSYKNNSVNQVKLARNIDHHINDHLWIAQIRNLYSTREKCAIIYELFPNIGSRCFEFLWDLGIDLDFNKSKKCLRST